MMTIVAKAIPRILNAGAKRFLDGFDVQPRQGTMSFLPSDLGLKASPFTQKDAVVFREAAEAVVLNARRTLQDMWVPGGHDVGSQVRVKIFGKRGPKLRQVLFEEIDLVESFRRTTESGFRPEYVLPIDTSWQIEFYQACEVFMEPVERAHFSDGVEVDLIYGRVDLRHESGRTLSFDFTDLKKGLEITIGWQHSEGTALQRVVINPVGMVATGGYLFSCAGNELASVKRCLGITNRSSRDFLDQISQKISLEQYGETPPAKFTLSTLESGGSQFDCGNEVYSVTFIDSRQVGKNLIVELNNPLGGTKGLAESLYQLFWRPAERR